VRSCFIYPVWRIEATEVRWWLPSLAAVFTTATLWRYRRSSSGCWVAWAWFCVSLAPALGLTERLVVADHYVHLALVSVVALAATAWATLRQRAAGAQRWLITAAEAAVVGLLALLSYRQAELYTDSVAIFRDATVQCPDAANGHHNLGYALLRAGRPQEAIAEFAEAVRLAPDSPEAHANLGAALAQTGQREAAAAQLRQALVIRPEHAGTYNDLGAVLRESGRVDESIGYFEQALRLMPNMPEAHCNLAKALLYSGRRAEALEHLQAAAASRRDDADGCRIAPAALADDRGAH
jgi:Flp pilus assembly protein TadD